MPATISDTSNFPNYINDIAVQLYNGKSVDDFPTIVGTMKALLNASACKGKYKNRKLINLAPHEQAVINARPEFTNIDDVYVNPYGTRYHNYMEVTVGYPELIRYDFPDVIMHTSSATTTVFKTHSYDTVAVIADYYKHFYTTITVRPRNGLWFGYYKYMIKLEDNELPHFFDPEVFWCDTTSDNIYTSDEDIVFTANIYGLRAIEVTARRSYFA